MLFNSLTFALFFVIVYALFWIIPRWEARKILLLVASYVFYAAWNPPYILLLFGSTSLDWWLARLIGRAESERKRQALLALSLISNLGVLSYFKYGEFLLRNFSTLLGSIGVHFQPPQMDIVLPVGISFYTFASLSYTIDVFRGEIRSDWRFRDYALFVSFFPHLVAGPIVRARLLLSQIENPRDPSADQVGWGLILLCIGLFAKVVLADTMLAPLVDKVYSDPRSFGAEDTWAAVFGFCAQIYYDFSGYSACAIGLALCFGFRFPDNFKYPYGARGFSDFWHRWHISLSTWLRDYLYIPLGGNRRGSMPTYVNLAVTMLLGGLWHGASWMFVLWGGLHGLYLALERALLGSSDKRMHMGRKVDISKTLATFLVITLTWIPFRASTPSAAVDILSGLFRLYQPSSLDTNAALIVFVLVAATVFWQIRQRDSSLEEKFSEWGFITAAAAIACSLVALFLCSGGDQRAFIYFQF